MFIFEEKPVISWPVSVQVAVNGGTTQETTLACKFVVVDEVEFADLCKKGDAIAMQTLLVGWDEGEVCRPNGTPLKFNKTNRDKLLRNPAFVRGLSSAYLELLVGAPAKNSKRPLSAGQPQ